MFKEYNNNPAPVGSHVSSGKVAVARDLMWGKGKEALSLAISALMVKKPLYSWLLNNRNKNLLDLIRNGKSGDACTDTFVISEADFIIPENGQFVDTNVEVYNRTHSFPITTGARLKMSDSVLNIRSSEATKRSLKESLVTQLSNQMVTQISKRFIQEFISLAEPSNQGNQAGWVTSGYVNLGTLANPVTVTTSTIWDFLTLLEPFSSPNEIIQESMNLSDESVILFPSIVHQMLKSSRPLASASDSGLSKSSFIMNSSELDNVIKSKFGNYFVFDSMPVEIHRDYLITYIVKINSSAFMSFLEEANNDISDNAAVNGNNGVYWAYSLTGEVKICFPSGITVAVVKVPKVKG
ncbi:MAG: hypothetical protein [Caudoviricetes sp.]|nr:MAG: hypothetical protein [Caudoviricetes sp.]